MKKFTVFAAAIAMVAGAVPGWGIEYSVTGLGYDPNWNAMNMATAINEAGQAAGFRGDSDFAPPLSQGFFWSNGVWTGLGALQGGTFSEAYGINGSGRVVGTADSAEGTQAFSWENGVVTGLGDDPGGIFGSSAAAVNDLGIVAGQCSDHITSWQACFYKEGAWYALGPGSLLTSIALDLSEEVDALGNPRFVGYGQYSNGWYEGFYWDSGSSIMLGDLAGGSWHSRARAMNGLPLAQIVGVSESEIGMEACLWEHPDPLSIVGLGVLPGDMSSEAFDINDREEVVGTSHSPPASRAFIWGRYLGMVDLNSMLDAASQGWTLLEARAINNQGQIVGRGRNPEGYTEAFLLTPVGEMDGDLDGYIYTRDCDDNNPAAYPGAPEVKHDGIDQDCNGYDLTVDIITLDYNSRKDSLKAEATSALGQSAELHLTYPGFSALMNWNSRKDKWSLTVDSAGGDPGAVTIVGVEGSETGYTSGEPPCIPESSDEVNLCSDGVDNDCDGSADCEDFVDCGADPACQAPDCSQYGDKSVCNAEPACRWSNKDKVCVTR